MHTIYTEDGKILIEKKPEASGNGGGSSNLAEVVNNVERNRKSKDPKEKKDVFDREPMRLCATGITAGGVGLGTMAAIAGIDMFLCMAIGMIAFYLTMIAKGSRHSTYCMVLAVINMLFAATMLIIRLKQMGALDWLQFSM